MTNNILSEIFKKNPNVDKKIVKYYYDYLIKENKYNEKKFLQGIDKLTKGEPIQYIIGNVDFYGNIIKVNKNVLIPRFETEQLIEKTEKYINQYLNKDNLNIIDIGTGSGCIAITLKKIHPNSNIDAVDISNKALEVAKYNAKKNKTNISFYQGNMLEPLNNKYDLIISNPPYIDVNEKIEDIVKNNEPHVALYAKEDGLEYYINILKNANKYLNKKSIIAFEIGYNQASRIIDIAKNYFPKAKIFKEKDYSDKDRYIFIINN